MGRRNKIYRNFLEDYVKDLYTNKRKTLKEISEIIQKEKNIYISSEAIRSHVNKEILHAKTKQNTV